MAKDKLLTSESKVEIKNLATTLEHGLKFFGTKYFSEVLGIKTEEVEDFVKALWSRF